MPDRAAGKSAIRGLSAHFSHMVDRLRGAEAAATFTENGVLKTDTRFEGSAAIAAWSDDRITASPSRSAAGRPAVSSPMCM
ncbi:nuclear transport factor 2 family protein [Streptomyces lincolnensis]|uniref:nuclear transport factor 2 family protein n=1 Tax=Streptomyces lincolnensis TaxID=1915 RepID=UPI001E642AE7|nr:nuclear transport factor 2 family protein [Streptomyces lincolnensis]MCD7439722.1 nuclear transport factor 2 family protein [Streptomyces lincolnensis]